MKTERFDEEFRRKLLGLPVEADPGEVERIQGFVHAHRPALPSLGWGKLLLYGGSSLLLLGSLSYNLIQNYRNTHLQSSIDSLAHQSESRATPSREVIRYDTVYITQSGHTERVGSELEPTITSETVGREPSKQANSTPSAETRRSRSLAKESTESRQSGAESSSGRPVPDSPLATSKANTSAKATVSTAPNQRREQPGREQPEKDNVADSSPEPLIAGETRLAKEKNSVTNSMPDASKAAATVYSNNRTVPATRSGNRRRARAHPTSISSDTRHESLATNYSGKQEQRTGLATSTAGFMPANTEDAKSNEAASEGSSQSITVQPLASRLAITTSKQGAMIVPGHSLVIPKNELSARATRRPWHLTMPSLAVPNAQYRIGGELTAGNDQFGGALLGEIMLNPRWSVQTGLRAGYGEGFHYRHEQDFNEHQHEDFRKTYASQVSSWSDIQNIKQEFLLVQVPLQVAYHLPLGRQWGLRLGAGTDLDVWLRSGISYDYQENSRSSEHGLSRIKEHVYVFNNLTLSPSVERSWKKWLFRAGPFISPQLRPVGYKPDDFSWGANLQILYRLRK